MKKVQHRAARWVLHNFSRYTAMIEHLSWPSLELWRKISILQTLYKIINQHCSQAIPPCFISMRRSTRLYHPSSYVLPNSCTYSYQQSFYPRSIKDWNNLPTYLIECDNFDSFQLDSMDCILPNYFCNYSVAVCVIVLFFPEHTNMLSAQ